MKRTILWVSIVAITTILMAGSMPISPIAFADDDDDNGNGEGTEMRGSGTGTVTCADGTTVSGVTMFMDFRVDPFGNFGSYQLRSGSNAESSTLRVGELTTSEYDLDGIHFERTFRSICSGIGPTVGSVSGDCGLGVTITVEAVGNLKGTFTGNVACI